MGMYLNPGFENFRRVLAADIYKIVSEKAHGFNHGMRA